MKQKIALILFLIIGINWSCRDEIDLVPADEQLSSISIQSQLIKGNPSVIRANIQRVFTYSATSRKVLPITAVVLEDDLGNEFPLSRRTVGYFVGVIPENYSAFKVDYGRNYRLKAVVDGKQYASTFESLAPVPKMDDLSFDVFMQNAVNTLGELSPRRFARIRVTTPLTASQNGEKAKLKWNILRMRTPINEFGAPIPGGCLSLESPDFSHLEVLDGSKLAGDTINGLPIFETLIQFFYGKTYYLLVYQESLSQSAYNYWTELKTNVERDGTQFQPAVGVIRSNFKNVADENESVFGYFYVSAQDTMLIKACLDEETFEVSSFPKSICDLPNGPADSFWQACQ